MAEGSIRADECVTMEEFTRRTRIGEAGFRQARRTGLIVRRVGARNFVIGEDWLAYVRSRGLIVAPDGTLQQPDAMAGGAAEP